MIPHIFQNKKPVISMEVFPPKPDAPVDVINQTLSKLSDMHPDYISVTYGAGGSNTKRNREVARRIVDDCGCPALGHLTCVGASPDTIDNVLDGFIQAGITDVLALRGDVPGGMSAAGTFTHFRYASELVAYIAKRGGFSIAAACYPETHFESDTAGEDMDMLKRKVDCGVELLVSQLFFDTEAYLDFCTKARASGIEIPITAGVMPVRDASQILRMTTLCGASIPAALSKLIARYGNSQEDFAEAGFEYACGQIRTLLDNGVDGVHLYTMNRPALIRRIVDAVL